MITFENELPEWFEDIQDEPDIDYLQQKYDNDMQDRIEKQIQRDDIKY